MSRVDRTREPVTGHGASVTATITNIGGFQGFDGDTQRPWWEAAPRCLRTEAGSAAVVAIVAACPYLNTLNLQSALKRRDDVPLSISARAMLPDCLELLSKSQNDYGFPPTQYRRNPSSIWSTSCCNDTFLSTLELTGTGLTDEDAEKVAKVLPLFHKLSNFNSDGNEYKQKGRDALKLATDNMKSMNAPWSIIPTNEQEQSKLTWNLDLVTGRDLV